MSQIDDKGYAIPYAADNRKLYKIGVVFSTEKRNVSDWKISAGEGEDILYGGYLDRGGFTVSVYTVKSI